MELEWVELGLNVIQLLNKMIYVSFPFSRSKAPAEVRSALQVLSAARRMIASTQARATSAFVSLCALRSRHTTAIILQLSKQDHENTVYSLVRTVVSL